MSSKIVKGKLVKGRVVLIRKNVFQTISGATGLVSTGIKLIGSSVEYDVTKSVFFKLISRTKFANDKNGPGKVGRETCLENNVSVLRNLGGKEEEFDIYFDWNDAEMGTPGGFYVINQMNDEFFLVSMTLEYSPPTPTSDQCSPPSEDDTDKIHFVCNSWIYNRKCYKTDRIFFDSIPYLPGEQTPETLRKYRDDELKTLKGDGTGERQEWDRIYDYDVYNDLGFLDSDGKDDHPILGGGSSHPYPRRVRTGRKLVKNNNNCYQYETPGQDYYVPRDERFSNLKASDFLQLGTKLLAERIEPLLLSLYLKVTPNEFNSFEEVQRLYEGGVNLPVSITPGTPNVLQFPPPDVIKESKFAWLTDEEFAREMVAGINPCVIRILKEEEITCGCKHTSTVTKEQLETNMNGVKVDEAFHEGRLFVLDYYDVFTEYLKKINDLPSAKAYATKTFLFLKDDGTLKPLAIELSKPGAATKVVLPADRGVESIIWLLAKVHVIVNDTNYHQLISHWLNTHAVMEPFAISTNRNLSVLHPIYKLLHPHYRDTIQINALARQSLINAGSIIEQTFLPGPYSMEMSSAVYKKWAFTDQALPKDLLKRGVAVKDQHQTHGLRLLIKDYPYAVDGLQIWDAIKKWVRQYISLYYSDDEDVKQDTELQAWWKEVVEKGHGDSDKAKWPKMVTSDELIETCTTIIWIASALHAAVNFGQYPYGGYILNRPTQSRRWIPEQGTQEYDEMSKNPQEAFLRTITPKYQTVIDLTVLEILSRHGSDEVYLGQRDSPNWTADQEAKDLFKTFTNSLAGIETDISDRNLDKKLKNRTGPVKLPYTLLVPTSEPGVTFRGIPNSISI